MYLLLKECEVMRLLRVTMLGAGILLLPTLAVAQSGRPAASAWFDAYGRSNLDRSVAIQAATDQERARSGGFGPAQNTTNIAGDYNQYQTYNGPVISSSVTNVGQSNSTEVTASGGSTVSVTTGQTSHDTNQNGSSGVYVGRVRTDVVQCERGRVC